ncbi:IclR family transcriptional regulator [Ruegeria lacuscaerulensis]|uniref:IclR family transcriptional regulator n=1 Tax=Ruegeria lacuscaerulensis TaxID=55218 RepID=UPI00147BF270|nr:IclR family transcriptional regulator [Ruegeria lacuscaerulensis]
MKTVDKAMSVLDQFSMERIEIGLSEIATLSGLDKAATRRLLVALAKHGFIEQVAAGGKYRLGHGFLRLARIREATVPIVRAAQETTDWLSEQVDETVHISVPGEKGMTTIAYCMPSKGNVINIIPTQILPFHLTSSGLIYLAFATDKTRDRILSIKREKTTDTSLTKKPDIVRAINEFREAGYSQSRNTFENGVASIAMPFFAEDPDPVGTVAIAVPDANMNEARINELLPFLQKAVARMQSSLTGFQ